MNSGALRLVAAAVTAFSVLTACGSGNSPRGSAAVITSADDDALNGTDITDVVKRPALQLTDTAGKPFDLQARPAEELTAVFFGYTNCPDVCPTAMADLAAARRRLAPDLRARLQVVFVTEDPERDTPAVLSQWLNRFDSSFLGVLGGNARTRAALAALKAPQTEIKNPVAAGVHHDDGHSTSASVVEHTGSVYLFSRSRTVVYTGGTTPGQYADDVRMLAGAA